MGIFLHNFKLRMSFISPKNYVFDWLSANLSESDIKKKMKPLDENTMTANTFSKRNMLNRES
jgi:hypothetical protein